MPLWRCPHCGTPQVESSRCWVCRRSTTSCAACRHFRRGVAGGLGLCGLDPKHLALRGTEMRGCWEAAATTGSFGPGSFGTASFGEGSFGTGSPGADVPELVPVMAMAGSSVGRPVRTFVPVPTSDQVGGEQFQGLSVMAAAEAVAVAAIEAAAEAPALTVRPRRIPGGWSLWGDLEA